MADVRALLAGPMMLIAARARRRPTGWLLPVIAIAMALAFAGGVAAEGVITGDQAARASLRALTPLQRTVRITWSGPVTASADRAARTTLATLGLPVKAQTRVVLLNPVRLSGGVVRPAAISPLPRWVSAAAATPSLDACRPASCPVLQASGGKLPVALTAAGVRLIVSAHAPLRSAVPLAYATASAGAWPLLLSGDPSGLDLLPGLSGVYRIHSWLAVLPAARLHSWEIAAAQSRLARAQSTLAAAGTQFSLSAPFEGLAAASAQAGAAPRQLLLAGGGALATLILFVVLTAAVLRGDQQAELGCLRSAGAHAGALVAFAVLEAALLSAVALLLGAALAVIVGAALAHTAGEPVGAVLSHGLFTRAAAATLLAAWPVCTALIAAFALVRARGAERVLDVLGLLALVALLAGLGFGAPGGGVHGAWTLLFAPLCCLAAGVLVFRGAVLLLRAAERAGAGRRAPAIAHVALAGLARAPAAPALAAAFLAVSVGLGGFALAYRATLIRGAADQAAASVPLDALVSATADFRTPLELAPLSRWRELARGGAVLPVRRTIASYASGEGDAVVPALGVPAAGLTRIHGWRRSDGSAPLATLARRLAPSGPVRTPGPRIPPGTRAIALSATSHRLALTITADLRDPAGAIRQLPLGTAAGPRALRLQARTPAGAWELEALELSEPLGVQATNGHQNAENPAAATQAQARVRLGPLRFLGARGRPLATVSLDGWRGAGAAASNPASPSVFTFDDSDADPGIVRPQQPTDTQPLPVLADPQTAAAAAPGGLLALTLDNLPVSARVVGVIRRFPTVASAAGGVIVADEQWLAAALDAQLPGQGRADELWIADPDTRPLRAALRTAPLAPLAASFRATRDSDLRAAPVARGVLHTLLAATLLSGSLAALGLLLALLGAFRDPRVRADLEVLGVGPRGLRVELRTRLAVAGTLGLAAGIVIALLLTRFAVGALGDADALAPPQPPLVTVIPVGALGLWALAAAAVIAVAGALATIERAR